MSVEAFRRQIEGLVGTSWGGTDIMTNVQRLALNTAFPNDFEYYMLAFEVIDASGQVMERFTFPVLPSMIRHTEGTIKNIEKTFGGVTTNYSTSFVPYPINLAGNFGRKLRFTIGVDTPQMMKYTYADPTKVTGNDLVKKALSPNPRISTGFGFTQKLKRIFRYSKSVDKRGRPFRIVFYNMAAGEVVFVEMETMVTDMSEEKNMIWNYNVQMTAVGEVAQVSLKEKFSGTKGDGGASKTSSEIGDINFDLIA